MPPASSLIPLPLRIGAWAAVAAWARTIWYFSSLTGPEIEQIGVTLWDKAAHFGAFSAGGVLLALALRWSTAWPWKKLAPFASVVLVVFGALDETHQLFTANRTGADPLDWLADCFGALAGILVFILIHVRFIRPYPPAPTRA